MLKNFSLTFNLNCLINRGFVKSTRLLKNEFSSICSRTRELNGILKSLDDQYLKGAIGLDAYAVKAKMANKELADLNTKQKQMTGIVSSVDSLAQKGGGLIAFGAAVYGLAQRLMGVVKTAAEFEAAMYLHNAQAVLGDAFDYAVNICHFSGEDFIKMFVVSTVSTKIANGGPAYTKGKSGLEVLMEIVQETTGRAINIVPVERFARSPEYWIGWAISYYQWFS